jgi:hypothetical protein
MSKPSPLKALIVFAISLIFSLSFTDMANAANTATVIAPAGTASYSDGVMYNGSLWIKNGSTILQYTGSGSVTTAYTIPSTVGGVSVGTLASKRIEVDKATGIMYFSSNMAPMKIWSLDLNNLNNGPTLLFSGVSGCGSYTGGMAKVGSNLYFSCPDAYTLANNKLYRFTIPSTGSAAVGDSALTTVSNGTVLKSFFDLEYRSQDGYLFAINGEASSGEVTTIVKMNLAATVPLAQTAIYSTTPVGGLGGISGIDIDSQGDIFFLTRQGSTSTPAGYQVTSEANTPVTTSSVFSLPNTTTDCIYGYEFIVDQGSLSTGSQTIGYSTNGHGGILKISGNSVNSYATVNDVLIVDTTTTISIPSGPFIYRQSYSITATSTASGKITFYVNRKPAAGCRSIPVNSANSYTATCNYKPTVHGAFLVYASFTSSTSNIRPSQSPITTISVIGRTGTR